MTGMSTGLPALDPSTPEAVLVPANDDGGRVAPSPARCPSMVRRQWRKWRIPVTTMAMPALFAASTTS